MDYDDNLAYWGINFGLLEGKYGLLIVKTGSGGTIYGHNNKYLTMAKKIREKYGFGVIVSDNPVEVSAKENMFATMQVAQRHWEENIIGDAYYFGASKGAQYAAMYAYKYEWVSKWLLVNMPLMINWYKSMDGLEHLCSLQKMIFVFGDKDPSFKFVDLIDLVNGKNIAKIIVPEADHNFSNMMDEFIHLPDQYLFVEC